MLENPEPNYLRAWREHRRMTRVKLADAVGASGAVISLLESGDRQLSPKWLSAIAPAPRTRPGYLLDIDPSELSGV